MKNNNLSLVACTFVVTCLFFAVSTKPLNDVYPSSMNKLGMPSLNTQTKSNVGKTEKSKAFSSFDSGEITETTRSKEESKNLVLLEKRDPKFRGRGRARGVKRVKNTSSPQKPSFSDFTDHSVEEVAEIVAGSLGNKPETNEATEQEQIPNDGSDPYADYLNDEAYFVKPETDESDVAEQAQEQVGSEAPEYS